MKDVDKRISSSIFAIIVICFFLPFITFSCQNQELVTFKGTNLITGTTIEKSSPWGDEMTHWFDSSEYEELNKVSAEPLAILAFICAIAGLGLGFLKGRKIIIAPAIMGVAGIATLILLKSGIDNEVLTEGKGIITVEYGIGFWLALILFFVSTVLNFGMFFRDQTIALIAKVKELRSRRIRQPKPKVATVPVTSSPPSVEAEIPKEAKTTVVTTRVESNKCPNCGADIRLGAKFCKNCGTPLLPDISKEQEQVYIQPKSENICPECGNKVRPGAKFCRECGAKVGV